jgi:hypothetical protein
MTPEEASQKLFSQQGLQAGQPVTVKNAKVARSFVAQSQQGAVEGVAAFVSHEGTTYVLLGYTPQGSLTGYVNTFLESMSTFGDLTDNSALSVKPATLKLVHIDQPMSAADFNSKYPSTTKLQTVALINGVESGGQIPAGYAKQIVGGSPEGK